jgi:RNA polymerase sigma factor (sigma-70 family)
VHDVKALLIENLPHLERYALHLTRSRTEAEDLVQDCAERALLKSELFQAGSNFRAWLFTIMHNLFLNKARRNRVAAQYLADARPRLGRAGPPPQPARRWRRSRRRSATPSCCWARISSPIRRSLRNRAFRSAR